MARQPRFFVPGVDPRRCAGGVRQSVTSRKIESDPEVLLEDRRGYRSEQRKARKLKRTSKAEVVRAERRR